MASFAAYLRQHDGSKVTWAPLWEKGERTIRPSTVTFDTSGRILPGKNDAGLWTTGAKEETVPLVTLRLPHPFDQGIDFDSFSSADADVCINHLIAANPWLRRVRGKASVIKMAKERPGNPFIYESSNGYWRSSIHALVRDFATYRRTGVDPRTGTGVAEPKSNTKRKAVENDAVDEYAEEDAEEEAPVKGVPVSTESVGVPVAKKLKAKVAVDPDLYKPPSAHFQIFRYAGECDALEKRLKKRHLFRYATPGHWIAIREWMKSKEGRAYLKNMCDLDPEGVQLDHIRPKDSGELNHMYNCYFMPSSVNAHFKDRWDDEKKRYIGERARIKSGRFMRWHAKQAAELVDVGLYKGHLLG
jgi:hypothetical protein